MELVPLVLNTPILLFAAVSDLRGLKIPNKLALISVVVFCLTCPLLPFPEVVARLLAAAATFAVLIVMFALRLLGGGDVKILAALMLFIPSYSLPLFGFVLSIALLISIALLVLARAIVRATETGFAGFDANGAVPMGVPIAWAGIAHLIALVFLG